MVEYVPMGIQLLDPDVNVQEAFQGKVYDQLCVDMKAPWIGQLTRKHTRFRLIAHGFEEPNEVQ
jgi:hypothetical protein